MRLAIYLLFILSVATASTGCQAQNSRLPRVELVTQYGTITLEIDVVRAPVSGCAFLNAVNSGVYSGGHFNERISTFGIEAWPQFVNAPETAWGSEETSDQTGIPVAEGSVLVGNEGSSFGILTSPPPSVDSRQYGQVKVFGRVVSGLSVARRIYSTPIFGMDI